MLLTNLVMHIAVLGSDIAKSEIDPTHVPFNVIEYDVTSVVCQAIFIAGIWSISMNAGSHTAPPPWTHRRRHSQPTGTLLRDGDVEYAGAVREAPSHNIGGDSGDEN